MQAHPTEPKRPMDGITMTRIRPVMRARDNLKGVVRRIGGYGKSDQAALQNPEFDQGAGIKWCLSKGFLVPGDFLNTYVPTREGLDMLESFMGWKQAMAQYRKDVRAWNRAQKTKKAA